MDDDDPGIAPSQLYAWAALTEGVPFINGATKPDGRYSRH